MTARFRPSADVVAQRHGDELVLVHLKADRIFVLNRTGACLWELLCDGHEWDEIERRMLAQFDVTQAQFAGEVKTLLAALEREHLLEPANDPPTAC